MIGAALNVAMAAIMGGDLGQAALLGAVSGAITAGFGAWGASVLKGVADPGLYSLGKGAFDAVGAAAAGAAGAAIKGEPIGTGALEGFKMSVMMSAANYAVGQWSGWSKDKTARLRPPGSENSPLNEGSTVGISGIGTPLYGKNGAAGAYESMKAGPQIHKGVVPPGYGKPFDVFFHNPSHGGILDVVECAQDILFGPGSASRSLGAHLQGMSGIRVNIIAHSQGTIGLARGMQIAGNSGTRFGAGSTVTFNNPPIDPISAYSAAWQCGVGNITYRPDCEGFGVGDWEFGSMPPTSIPFIPNLTDTTARTASRAAARRRRHGVRKGAAQKRRPFSFIVTASAL